METVNQKSGGSETRRPSHSPRPRRTRKVASLGLAAAGLWLAVVFLAGCQPKSGNQNANYFKTPFQEESQFIVEAVVSDLAEQMYYAATHRLPPLEKFSVTATEKPGSPPDAPEYALRIRLDAKHPEVVTTLTLDGPIWSPSVYQDVAADLAQAAGLPPANAEAGDDTDLLSQLTDTAPDTIVAADQEVSAALQSDFSNAALHEQAALLLGAFLLRDHSGDFFEIRTPLSRITAHLAMAHFLGGANAPGLNGRLAQAILLTLLGDEAPALQQLKGIGANVAAAPLVRALRTRNTGDYRPLDNLGALTPCECLAWFATRSSYVSLGSTWPKLSDSQQKNIDFVRAANEQGYSVEIGHQLLAVSLPLELREIGAVYKQCRHQALPRDGLVKALNELPERCFHREAGGAAQVQVIGWGQWALFLQRHLCHAIQQNFEFMQYSWGVPDDAKAFAAQCDQNFDGLRLYPFVRRFICTTVAAYHQSVDDGFKVTVNTPHLVPAECWNYLCYKPSFAPPYTPNPNPHVNEWHLHNPPPGTVYDLCPRLRHPSLIGRPDALACFEKLHELAPYDCRIGEYILTQKYHDHPTYDQATTLFQAELPYSLFALKTIAGTVIDQPDRYEELMLQAAELDPSCYYALGDAAIARNDEDKAAKYYDQAADSDTDSVRVSNLSVWRVRYCLKKGQTEKARKIADFAGEVYSATGLRAEGIFFEETEDYDEAFNWFAKEEERYDDASDLIDFCQRYKDRTGGTRFEAEMQKRLKKIFPQGMEKVSLSDFQKPPTDGVVFREQSDLMTDAGLHVGDVIVAVYGVRVHNDTQYYLGRGLKDTPELDLIVWQGNAYREFKPSLPGHRFGVDVGTYAPN